MFLEVVSPGLISGVIRKIFWERLLMLIWNLVPGSLDISIQWGSGIRDSSKRIEVWFRLIGVSSPAIMTEFFGFMFY